MIHTIKPINVHKPRASLEKASDKPLAVAIALVKNEGDMIAVWISHICALFDMVYIVDHLSIDGTREFLLEVSRSRDNIQVFSFENPGHFQAEISNQLAEIAAQECPNSWIFALDADEFLSITSYAELLSSIKYVESNSVLRSPWKNCLPLCLTIDGEFTFASPCLIPPFRGAYKKVAISSSAFVKNKWRFVQGNYGVKDDSGKILKGYVEVDLAELIHIPVRSLDHFALKCVQGYLAYDTLPAGHKDPRWGFHWTDMIKTVLNKRVLSPNLVREFIAHDSEPNLCSGDGASVYELIDRGWNCAPLDVAHLEVSYDVNRHYGFLQLAKEILKERNNKKLEDFLRIVSTDCLRKVAEIEPVPKICAD